MPPIGREGLLIIINPVLEGRGGGGGGAVPMLNGIVMKNLAVRSSKM